MKYLKKTTALLLSALLLFSAMVTGVTVSAEANTAAITAATVTVEAGGTVDVPVTVETTGLAAAIFTVTADDALTVNSAKVGSDFTEVYTDVYGNEYTFAVTAAGDANVTGTVTVVTLNVTAPAESAEAMAITVSDATAADIDENDVTVSTVNGSVTIAAPKCEHANLTYTPNNDGTHDGACADCTDYTIDNETCDTAGENGACSKCGYVAVVECEHANVNTTDAVSYVEFTETGITYYEICPDCSDKVVTSTDSSENAVTVAGKALKQQYYSAINVTEAGTYTIDVTETADLQYAYVKNDKIIANAAHGNMNDGNKTNGENKFAASVSGTTVTITTEFEGIFLAFVPTDSSNLPNSTTKIVGMSQTFDLGSSIAVNFMVNATYLDVFGEDVYAVINHKDFTGNVANEVVDRIVDTFEPYGVNYLFTYPIAAKQMGDDISATYYGVLNGIDYTLREKVDFSLVAYSISNNTGYKYTGEGADGLKTLLSTMFEYGATAQKYFVYRADEDSLVTNNPDIVSYLSDYPAAETVAQNAVTYTKGTTEHLDSNSKKFGVSKGLKCESTIEIYFRMNVKNFIAAYGEDELDNIVFKVYYKKGSKTVVDGEYEYEEFTINSENIEHETDGNGNNYYYFDADKITASMMPSMSKIEAHYNGQVLVTSYYSIHEYLNANYESTFKYNDTLSAATLGDMCKAIATYGAVAREYFEIVTL